MQCQGLSKTAQVRTLVTAKEKGIEPELVLTRPLRSYARPIQVRGRCCGAALGLDRCLIRPPCSATCSANNILIPAAKAFSPREVSALS